MIHFGMMVVLLVTVPINIEAIRNFYRASVPDISRYTLSPLGEAFSVLNREHCLSICSLGDQCRGFAFTSESMCVLLKHRAHPTNVIQGSYQLYIKDLISPETDTCGKLMKLEDLSIYISEQDPGK